MTMNNGNYVCFDRIFNDHNGVQQQMIAFCSDAHFDMLCHSDILFSDGTFTQIPAMVMQLYTVIGIYGGFCGTFAFNAKLNLFKFRCSLSIHALPNELQNSDDLHRNAAWHSGHS